MSVRMSQVLDVVSAMGHTGATSADVEELTGYGHGSVSAALSRATRQGRLHRLTERRDGFSVYVLASLADERPTALGRSNRHQDLIYRLERLRDTTDPSDMYFALDELIAAERKKIDA